MAYIVMAGLHGRLRGRLARRERRQHRRDCQRQELALLNHKSYELCELTRTRRAMERELTSPHDPHSEIVRARAASGETMRAGKTLVAPKLLRPRSGVLAAPRWAPTVSGRNWLC